MDSITDPEEETTSTPTTPKKSLNRDLTLNNSFDDSSSANNSDFTVKLILLGDSAVGKSK